MTRKPIQTTCPNGITHRSLNAMSRYYGIPLSTLWDRLNRQKLPLWAALGLSVPKEGERRNEYEGLSRAQKLRVQRALANRRKPCAYTRMLIERNK